MSDYDMVALLEHYGGNVTRSQGRFTMRCPFHDDHHNSGSVDLERGLYYCFVCGWGGDAIAVIMNHEQIGYPDAVTRAQEIAGDGDGTVRAGADIGSYRVPRGKRDRSKHRRTIPAWKCR